MRIILISTLLAIGTVSVTPSASAVDPVPTGTIYVVQSVVNDNLGKNVPNDFTLYVKHFGTNVLGSPFMATGGAGTTFVLEAGTYVVSQEIVEGYSGTWSGVGVENGFIDLQPGQVVTITRTLNDNGTAEAVVEEPGTEDGGILPNTATPWFNFLLVGALITTFGAFGYRKFASNNK